MNFFKKLFSSEKKETLDKGLEKSKTSFFDKLTRAIAGKSKVDDTILDELEGVLVSSDVGVDTTLKIIERIEKRVAEDKYLGTSELNKILREEIAGLLSQTERGEAVDFFVPTERKPYVIMVVGVNGAGKTTLMSILMGEMTPTAGEFSICGLSFKGQANQIRYRIGVVPQEYALYPTLTARENLCYFASLYGLQGKHLQNLVSQGLEL